MKTYSSLSSFPSILKTNIIFYVLILALIGCSRNPSDGVIYLTLGSGQTIKLADQFLVFFDKSFPDDLKNYKTKVWSDFKEEWVKNLERMITESHEDSEFFEALLKEIHSGKWMVEKLPILQQYRKEYLDEQLAKARSRLGLDRDSSLYETQAKNLVQGLLRGDSSVARKIGPTVPPISGEELIGFLMGNSIATIRADYEGKFQVPPKAKYVFSFYEFESSGQVMWLLPIPNSSQPLNLANSNAYISTDGTVPLFNLFQLDLD
jgi:hypothetical protein